MLHLCGWSCVGLVLAAVVLFGVRWVVRRLFRRPAAPACRHCKADGCEWGQTRSEWYCPACEKWNVFDK